MSRLVLIAGAWGLAITAAFAQNAMPLPRQSVSYADLDLSKAEGRDALQQRIDWAIDRLCSTAQPHRLIAAQLEESCRADALAGVQKQLPAIYADAQSAPNGAIIVVAGGRR